MNEKMNAHFSMLLLILMIAQAQLANGQSLSGDIGPVNVPDATWTRAGFTAFCISDVGEVYVQRVRGETTVDVYSSLQAFEAGSAPARNILLPGIAEGGQLIWVNGSIYGTNPVAATLLNHWDPNGFSMPTAMVGGTTLIAWGGTVTAILATDGNYIFLNKDSILEVRDLAEGPVNLIALPYSINALTTGFAAGRHYYPVHWASSSMPNTLTERVNADTGAITAWIDTLAMGCTYLTSANFDPFSNSLIHGVGNSMSCPTTFFLYRDLIPPSTPTCMGICGDCNEDGFGPNVTDALVAARIALALVSPSAMQQTCCDVNSSGTVDTIDALLMAQFAVGISVLLNCP